MSDTNKRAMVPQVPCDTCKNPMRIRTSLPSPEQPGMRELSYTCDECHAVKTILHRTDPVPE
jgi:hypothetical protein